MATTVHDPVCHMDIDPATAAGTSEYKDRPITSVLSAARNPSIRNRKNILAIQLNTKITLN